MKTMTQAIAEEMVRILSLENVVGVGIGHKEVRGSCTCEPAVTVLVVQKVSEAALAQRHRVPKRIWRFVTDVQEVGELVGLNRLVRMRPARPGTSLAHYQVTAGTYGAMVYDVSTGAPLLLSNNHVLANMSNGRDGRARRGDPVLQPGRYDGGTLADVIGHLERFVPIHCLSMRPSCPVAGWAERAANFLVQRLWPNYEFRVFKHSQAENLVDAAVAKPDSAQAVSPDILEVGTPGPMLRAEIEMDVKKSGRTTGLTFGQVRVIHATVKVAMGDLGEALFTEQIVTTAIGQPGDSGSLVLTTQNHPVGLLAAGSGSVTVCSDLHNVTSLLGVRF